MCISSGFYKVLASWFIFFLLRNLMWLNSLMDETELHRDEDDRDENIKETLRLVPKVVVMENM